MRFDERVVLVTGAARGIGAGIAQGFLEAGAAVAMVDINRTGAEQRAASLKHLGDTLVIECDVSDEAQVEAAVQQTVDQFGRLDVLVNNAGIEIVGKMTDYSSANWDRQLNVNLKSVFLLAKHAMPHLRRHRGSIVNIASVHAYVSYPETAAYDASKGGMLALTRTLALDHGPDGVRVNAICPGYIDTTMLEEWVAGMPDPEAARREILSHHPLGRIGTPRDIANAALFLASEQASFISGASLVVDGAMIVSGH